MDLETAKRAVVTVGGGRGFILNTDPRLIIITAAHCLPQLPPADPAAYREETTYQDLVGHIGEDQQKIWGECLFADPVADIAVLGEPDGQALYDQSDAYENFITELPALDLGRVSTYHPNIQGASSNGEEQGWLLGLGGKWESCRFSTGRFGHLWITEGVEGIVGGMSGSPLMNTACQAVGLISVSGGSPDTLHTEGGPGPSLQYHLPGWILASLT